MKEISRTKILSFNLIFLFGVLYFINALAINYSFLGIIVGLIGYTLIFSFVFLRKIELALLAYLIFLTTSLEVQAFAFGYNESSIIYSFLVLPYVGVYLIFLVNIIFFLYFRIINKYTLTSEQKNLHILKKWSVWILIIGVISQLVSYVVNDNNIVNIHWYFSKLITEYFRIFMIFFTFYNFTDALIRFPKFYFKLRRTLVNLFLALVPGSVLTIIFELNGFYGLSTDVILMPLIYVFGLFIIIFALYYKKNRIVYLTFGIIMLYVTLNYSSPLGGKWFLLIFALLLITIVKLIYSKRYLLLLAMTFFMVVLVFFYQFDSILRSDLLLIKYRQAISVINIFNENWYQNMSDSPKFRLEEFINILIEYTKKPWFVIFGKGHAGTLTRHFGNLNWSLPGAFSYEESSVGVYVRVHSSINLIFLKYGLFGMAFLFDVGIRLSSKIMKNPWALLGLIWLILFYTVYSTLLIGAVSIVLGLFKLDSLNTRETMR
jgi:hypothetical protein